MTAKLGGKVALITGASRGIGRSVAEAFAREGAKLFLTGRVDREALEGALGDLVRTGEADGGLFDVSRYDEVKRLADAIGERYGALDIVVNNAGNIEPAPLLEITPEQWERTIGTHLGGTFYCTVEMVRRFMAPKRRGKIINVTAPSAVRGSYGVADYASAKAGIIAFTRNAARELLPLNIQVNAVLPVARSRMTDALAQYHSRFVGEESAARLSALPSPEVVVPPFIFFASGDSDYVTGQVLAADGGLTA
ncbi:MAG TPA: SDR family NAD(P)-dependent oxidoreductase [Candidatus Binataceae bacterium]|nr:SDR family NAD(P)-dependent oxidoreductase [Candidatus Binataceae bacterium]